MEMQLPAPPAESLPHQLGPHLEERIPLPASSSETPVVPEAASAFSEGLLPSLPSRDTEKRVWSKDNNALEAVANGEEDDREVLLGV